MKARALLLTLILPCTAGGHADGYALRRMSEKEMTRAADLVAYGTVVGTVRRKTRFYSVIEMGTILKGVASKKIEFLTSPGIAEMNPDCCAPGGHYLFYLVRIPVGGYESVNGRFGVVRLNAPSALH